MKKIALLLSGQFRTIEENIPALRRFVLDVHDTDIFISAWNVVGNRTHKHIHSERDDRPLSPRLVEAVRDELKPKVFVIEDVEPIHSVFKSCASEFIPIHRYSRTDINLLQRTKIISNVFSMFYKIHQVFFSFASWQMAARQQYHAVVRSRFDIEHHNPLIVPEVIEKDTLYLPIVEGTNAHVSPEGKHHGGCCDQFAIGSATTIGKFSTCFVQMAEVAREIGVFNPEIILDKHVQEQGLLKSFLDIRFRLNWGFDAPAPQNP